MLKQGLVRASDSAAIDHLREGILAGRNWYVSLLEAIGLWTSPEETYEGRTNHYLIDEEAFDWLLLAERLCDTACEILNEAETHQLLFRGLPPFEVSKEEFKELVGATKYYQHLSFFYGVTVEEMLLLTVREEVRKDHRNCGGERGDCLDEAYCRIYDAPEIILLELFRNDKKNPHSDLISLGERKEFAYWRFKRRLRYCDKARVASDTRKALDWMKTGKLIPRVPGICI